MNPFNEAPGRHATKSGPGSSDAAKASSQGVHQSEPEKPWRKTAQSIDMSFFFDFHVVRTMALAPSSIPLRNWRSAQRLQPWASAAKHPANT